MSASRMSMPHTSRPPAAARQHIAATSGWTRSVTSVLVPPVDRLALRRSVTTCPARGTDPGWQALRRKVGQGVVVERDPGQRPRVPLAPARVGIGLPDQGLDVLAAVSGHRRRMQPGGRHHVPSTTRTR